MNIAAPRPDHVPGDHDIWVFVLGDMVIFSCYFAAYLFLDRMSAPSLFRAAQAQLSQALGVLNTLVLLTSSLMVALSVDAARSGAHAMAARRVAGAGALGVGFLVVKAYEWHAKIASGLTITTNAFFMHYYIMTSLHVMHVLVGLVFLSIMWRELHARGAAQPHLALLEVGATYWHMVDFLWIVIFALLYLMR